MAEPLTPALEPACRDEQRRADVLAHPVLNGIDFVEYAHRPGDPLEHVLVVSFLKPLPDPPHSDPDGAYDLTAHPERIRIEGGTRIVGLRVLGAVLVPPRLEIAVDKAGDFSTYWLSLGWVRQPNGDLLQTIPELDPRFSVAPVDFKAECPSELDCHEPPYCPPDREDGPALDYMAKDYASFRQLLLDLIALRNPDWLERNPADLGIALVELLAYAGDHLSYLQDAVANEAYLDTARQRISAKRHARLVDYRMHDGRNAWTFVHVRATSAGTIPQAAALLTRIGDPLRGQTRPPATVMLEADLPPAAFDADPALARARVFETAFALDVHPENNDITVHAWGNLECCLPRGTTAVYLYATDPAIPEQAVRPALAAGDYLLLEEVAGPETGVAADADPRHRQVVRVVRVEQTEDTAYRDVLAGGDLQVRALGETALPLLRVSWSRDEALAFPLCVSARTRAGALVAAVSVARGNVVLADHGRTVHESFPQTTPVPPDRPFTLQLGRGPLTVQCQPEPMLYGPAAGGALVPLSERRALDCGVREARPAVALGVELPTGAEVWREVPDLLDSPGFAQHFVVDVDNDGRGRLRFGDGQYGREPAGATGFAVSYRVGNGRDGNVGAEALGHLVRPTVAPAWPDVEAVRNPLAAAGGEDPESIDVVRALAPAAFRAEQFRAVTEADYAAAARLMPGVAGAVAAFRWTGSWYTVLIAVDPVDPLDLVTLPGGRTRLAPAFAARVRAFVGRYRLAGYDLEVRSGEYVPLEIDVSLCVARGHFRGDVLGAVGQALGSRVNPDGSRGFFHPDNLGFGQPVYLSALYAAIEAVEGVDSAVVTRFRLFGEEDNGELDAGVIPIGAWQIARLDNDPNFQENGVLRLGAGGGK